MPRETLEQEVDRAEVELEPLLRGSEDSAKAGAQPPIRLRRTVEGRDEVFVPRTQYRFNYRQPERLSAEETRRRRYESALAEATVNVRQAPPVSGKTKAHYAFQRSEASAADNRRFGAAINPRTIFGTEAHILVSQGLKHHFRTPLLAIPCIQRLVRREVMFAKRRAGRGYRVPHVRSLLSMIGC